MSNLKFIKRDISNTYDSLTQSIGSSDADHPMTNFLTDSKSQTWRSTVVSSQEFIFTWNSDQTVGGVGLAFTNLVVGNKYRVRFYSDSSGTVEIFDTEQVTINYNQQLPIGFTSIGSASFSHGGGTYLSVFSGNLTNVRRVTFNVVGANPNPDGYYEISRIIIGESFSPEINPIYGASFSNVDSTTSLRAASGDHIINRGTQHKTLKFTNSWLSVDDSQSMMEMLRVNGTHTPVFASVLSNETNHLYQAGQIYGRFTDTSVIYNTYQRFATTLEIEEF